MEYKVLDFEVKPTLKEDSGVVHVYDKETQAFLGFFKYRKSDYSMSQFMSDNKELDNIGDRVEQASKEITAFRRDFIEKEMLPSGFRLDANGTMAIKMEYIVDKGDGTPPIKKTA